jgi:hypothetical protein
MSRKLPKPSMFRRVFFAVWGMATLVLFFTVALLAMEMAERGQAPLTIVSETAPPPKPERPEPTQQESYKDILVYFGDATGRELMPESRRIRGTASTAENCKRALEEVLKGPRDALLPIVPEDTGVRAVFLMDDGRLVIDFTRDLQFALSSVSAEALMIYGIVNTLAQPELAGPDGIRVRSVQFLMEATVPRERFPAHFDLSEPVEPDPQWIASLEAPSTDEA